MLYDNFSTSPLYLVFVAFSSSTSTIISSYLLHWFLMFLFTSRVARFCFWICFRSVAPVMAQNPWGLAYSLDLPLRSRWFVFRFHFLQALFPTNCSSIQYFDFHRESLLHFILIDFSLCGSCDGMKSLRPDSLILMTNYKHIIWGVLLNSHFIFLFFVSIFLYGPFPFPSHFIFSIVNLKWWTCTGLWADTISA